LKFPAQAILIVLSTIIIENKISYLLHWTVCS